MKFICDGLSLSEAVLKTSKACAVRTTAPVLECIKVSAFGDEVTFLATDGELSIRKTIKAEIFEEGEVCLPGKLFSDFVGKLSEMEVTVQTGEQGVQIGYLDSGTWIQTFGTEEFPKIDLQIGENSFSVKCSELKRVIAETVFCCAQDDSRPILKGCLMELADKLEVTALDGYRLAVSNAEILLKTGAQKIVCPARTLVEISRMIPDGDDEIVVYTQKGMLMVQSEGTVIVSRLYQGEFIRKESVIPRNFTTVLRVSRSELISSVDRAMILIRGDKNNLVTLEIGGGAVKVSSFSEVGNLAESVPAETEGKELTISLNAKFLLDALRALKEERAELSFNGAVSPFILQNEKEKESLYLILPVRNAQ